MRRQRPRRGRRFKVRLIRFFFFAAVLALLFNYLRPLPRAVASITALGGEAQTVRLDWPHQGASAIGAQDFGLLQTHGDQSPRPMASIAKIITTLAVLEKHPLKKGQQGPSLTMNEHDIELFNRYYREGGAYVKIERGQKVTEYQALQAILLPSANNMADSLAIWAFGSIENYLAEANDMLKRVALNHTVVADDASGFSPASKSTPGDLVILGQFALQNEIIREIIGQPSANFPGHGIIYSANSRLAPDDIIGIKTGLTDEAGGCFLFAAKQNIGEDKVVTVIGVIMGQSSLQTAILASSSLASSAKKHFSVQTPLKAGEVFGTLSTAWLAKADVVAKEDISLIAWNGSAIKPTVVVAPINRSLPAGAQVGTATLASGQNKVSIPLVLRQPIDGPGWQWRIKRF